jgi:hypothetical protein
MATELFRFTQWAREKPPWGSISIPISALYCHCWAGLNASFERHGLVSPVLANIYLHYTLDLWFETASPMTL